MVTPGVHSEALQEGCSPARSAVAPESAGEEAPKEMYTDEYIRLWEPLEPLDPDRMTPAHKRAILRKLYLRSAPVYDRLAEL